ncbi:MAG TPA: riboflavin synthase [Candidatus Aminicenantes bacterium]|nr:riboflavin synthase [Candidatus Aminicenantes bacterium]
MFTGLIQATGRVVSLLRTSPAVLKVETDWTAELPPGGSVAVNGTCLSVIERKGRLLSFNLARETLRATSFADLAPGDLVNLERPLTLASPLDGHLVSGHVDGVARVRGIRSLGGSYALSFTFLDSSWRRYLMAKGSVTINGVSLTVTAANPTYFAVEVIPVTWAATNLSRVRVGERVNVELDFLAKTLYNLMKSEQNG